MDRHLPNISIEKYAAYLDGNLPEEEMQQMERFIENDEDMRAFLEADDIVDSNYTLPEQELIPFDIETDPIELPTLENDIVFDGNSFIDEFFSDEGDRIDEELGSIIDDGMEKETDDFGSLASDNVIELVYDTTCDQIITQDDLIDNELITPSFDDDI